MPDRELPHPELSEALRRCDLALDSEQQIAMDRFCRAQWEWNQRLNLTRHTNYLLFVQRDVVDAWHLAACLEPGEQVLDVGTGGGVPGCLVALLRPDVQVTVCDSMAKKAMAVGSMAEQLQLPVTVVHARAEEWLQHASFDTLTARAVGPLAKILRWFAPHWKAIGRLLLIKGPRWVAERGEARHLGLLRELELRRVAQYTVPETEWQSVILSIQPKDRGTTG